MANSKKYFEWRWISQKFGWPGFTKAYQRKDRRYWLHLLRGSSEVDPKVKNSVKRCPYNQPFAFQGHA